ncbi:glycosyltransferase family 4 protein [Candidatus Gottesmanbacteria bacterium]|nr:glycosyltransferase family 4 protein [Candidatus Gottesmanbacteria bacterium]
MKIAIIHNLPPGGQKRALFEQAKRLAKRHELDLFTLSSTNESFLPLKPFIKKHVRVTYNPPPHFPKSVFSIYYDLPIAYKLLAEKINDRDYDAAYVNPCYFTQAPYILRYLKTPSLYYCPEPKREFYESIPHISNRLTYIATYPFRLPIKSIDKTNTRCATRILTNSQYSQKRINKIYGVSSQINYLGVDSNIFKPIRASYSSSDPDSIGGVEKSISDSSRQARTINLALTVGELSLHKGHDFIIKSIAQIPQKERPGLLIIGHGGTEDNYLRQLAKSTGVNMDIKHNVTDEELVSWYSKAKVFLYAPLNEPFGMVLLEALSSGLPIVAVNEGGIPEIVNSDKLGLLVERNEKKFAQAIQKILLRLSFRSRRHVGRGISHDYIQKNWSWEKSVKELEKHLIEIAK